MRAVTRALDSNTKTNNNHRPGSEESIGGSSDLGLAPSNVMVSVMVTAMVTMTVTLGSSRN
jgi:hypothetical protein